MTFHFVDTRFVTYLPSCSCGWRSTTTTSAEDTARDLWRRHMAVAHGVKA